MPKVGDVHGVLSAHLSHSCHYWLIRLDLLPSFVIWERSSCSDTIADKVDRVEPLFFEFYPASRGDYTHTHVEECN